MRIQVICPLCGMWVHPNSFNVLKWPLKLFRKIMGGRHPNSKRGIVKQTPMEVTDEITQILTWRLEELADHLGYELIEKDYLKERTVDVGESESVKAIQFEFGGVREGEKVVELEFGGVRE